MAGPRKGGGHGLLRLRRRSRDEWPSGTRPASLSPGAKREASIADRAPARLSSLDGLRGLAAFVVVVGHCLLIDASMAAPSLDPETRLGGFEAAMYYSPLRVLWAAGEAVLVFFVLSGLVLSNAAASGRHANWRDYYPRRILRLYLPVAGCILLALPQAWLLRPVATKAGTSWWFNAHSESGGLRGAIRTAFLLDGTTWVNGALWSLTWEVWFSLALPIFLLLLRARRAPTAWALALTLLGCSFAGAVMKSGALTYLPVFGLGVLMSRHRAGLAAVAQAHGLALLSAGLGLFAVRWGLSYWASPVADAAGFAVAAGGAAVLVAACLGGVVQRTLAEPRWAQWLGRRSFSLYLVHEPLVVSTAHVLGGAPPAWVVLVVALPLSLIVSEWFGRLVEEPSHDLSKRVGAALGGRGQLRRE